MALPSARVQAALLRVLSENQARPCETIDPKQEHFKLPPRWIVSAEDRATLEAAFHKASMQTMVTVGDALVRHRWMKNMFKSVQPQGRPQAQVRTPAAATRATPRATPRAATRATPRAATRAVKRRAAPTKPWR
jgi:hypothetical protein